MAMAMEPAILWNVTWCSHEEHIFKDGLLPDDDITI
jgi:hypothetical protein